METSTARIQQVERSKSVWDAYRKAETGEWRIDNEFGATSPLGSPLSMFADGSGATIEVLCVPAGELQVSFIRGEAFKTNTIISITFFDDDGTDIRFVQSSNGPAWYDEPLLSSSDSGTVIHHMADVSQAIVDGMLLDGASEMKARFETRKRKLISGYPDVNDYAFEIAGFPAVHEILTGYCRLTPAEIQATIVAEALAVPTPTPTSPPTLTPTPPVTWHQEWCREQGNPHIGVEGHWHPLSGVEGTARLIVRCTGGVLVVGVHITRSDGVYPENKLGIAYAVQHGEGIEPYRHHEDGWQQVQGGSEEGLFIILPEVAAKDAVEILYGPQFENSRALKLWVLFNMVAESDPDQDPRRHNMGLGTDVVIPLRGLAVTHVLSANTSTSTPESRPTITIRLPEPTALLAPSQTPTSTPMPAPHGVYGPLMAEFSDVPASHNGEEVIRFQLRFTEPVSTSYTTLRDVAIQAENGTVVQSRRVDGSNDLWEITVEPGGRQDMVITLTAPADCDDVAAVCTEAGKPLSNSPKVSVPNGG